jgi:hypothetical protein
MYVPSWHDPEELGERLGENLLARIKAELDPAEYLLWADRPARSGAIRMPPVPALFVAVLAGLSGFALAALFGLIGQSWLDPWTLIFALGLGPCVLGCLIAADLMSKAVCRWLRQRRLARVVYALTDLRAIVARIDTPTGELGAASLRLGMVMDFERIKTAVADWVKATLEVNRD